MKQTAVEWLFEQLCSEKLSWNKDSNDKLFFDKITSDILEQAKEMEKKQLCYFYIKGVEAEMSNPYITNIEFYNKTFKSKQ